MGQTDCMVSGKSYMVVGVSNNVDPNSTITTATVNILKPNAQTEVYTIQGPNFVQSFIQTINSNNQSAFSAEILSEGQGLIQLTSKSVGTVNNGSSVRVFTTQGNISALLRPMHGGQSATC